MASRTNQFAGHLCRWCAGTMDSHARYQSTHQVLAHAREAHFHNGIPNHNTHLFTIDKPNASPTDRTEAIEAHLLFTPRNLPANMFCIEQPPDVQRTKSHKGWKTADGVSYVRKTDGTHLLDMNGDPVMAYANVPSQMSSKAHPAYYEYLIHQQPNLGWKEIAARMQQATKVPKSTRFTNIRAEWRNDPSKGFMIRPVISHSNEVPSLALLKLLDNLRPRQLAFNTVADVDENGVITQPRPSDLQDGELWTPPQLDV